MNLFQLSAGLLLTFFGRKLYWLFVGMVGFAAGAFLSTSFFHNLSDMGRLAVCILCGILGLILAIFLQRIAIAVAGGLSAGYFCMMLLKQFPASNTVEMILIAVAFVLGAVFAGILFDWALILFSVFTGSALVSMALPIQKTMAAAAFLVLLILGLFVQIGVFRKQKG